MSVQNPEETQVQIPMDIVVKRLRAKLEEAEWRVTLLESQIEMMQRPEQTDPED